MGFQKFWLAWFINYLQISGILFLSMVKFRGFSNQPGEWNRENLITNPFCYCCWGPLSILNSLNRYESFQSFGVRKWRSINNHLAYENDKNLFLSSEKKSMKFMIKVLKKCEVVTGQLINLKKVLSMCMRRWIPHWWLQSRSYLKSSRALLLLFI